MTIIFNGNDFKYELESVVKLFYPAQSFNFLYDETDCEGDFCFTRLKKGKEFAWLFVIVRINQKTAKLSTKIKNSVESLDNKCEFVLAKMLFLCLEKLTGTTPKWGILTGVRPVKRVNSMIARGITKDEIIKNLKDKFLVSEDKINLAYKTAKIQEPILKSLDEKSFSLYISIPFCPTRCRYCSFVSDTTENSKKQIPLYIENLCKEIIYTARLTKDLGLSLDTVYFGGGTPTAISAEQLALLMKTIEDNFDMSKLREYTIEAGRADTITREKLQVIKDFGATRISINPQTLNDDVLKAIGRNHSVKQFYESYNLARQMGFDNINMDLIAGLMTDTVESFKNTIDEVIKLNPENVTVHTLYIKRCSDIVNESENIIHNPAGEMVSYASSELTNAGYNPYYLYRQKNTLGNLENTGYSKKGTESLYNIYIMEEIQTIIALGAGASTKLVSKDKGIERIFNYKFPLEYNNHFDIMLDKKQGIIDFYKNK